MTNRELRDLIIDYSRRYVPQLVKPAITWDGVRHKIQGAVNRYTAILRALERLAPRPGPALDVGVGHGIPLLLYARVLPDLDWHGVDVPWATFAHPDLKPFAPKIRGCDLEKDPIPFDANFFHAAVLSEVAEHIPPPAFTHALEQIHRVLAPGGVLIVTSPNLVALMNRLIFLVGCSPFHLPIRSPNYGGGYPHIHLYSAREVAALGRKLGYEVAAVEHHTYFSYALIQHNRWRNAVVRIYLVAETLLGAVIPSLRDGWLVALRKPKP